MQTNIIQQPINETKQQLDNDQNLELSSSDDGMITPTV